MIKTEDIIKISSYFSKIHHIKGRLRVRVSPQIKEDITNISLTDIETLPQKINGIKNIKINKLVASITIEYDATIFSESIWEDLLAQKNLDEITILINNLSKEVM